ncbi:N-acetylmuramoyl-L-alanine amidase [Methylophilales bacterium MBRSG12]|uniref:N-acetylmuramoyl-L-alanine amidase AmiC n=1 Tax=Methylophilales bacterium MBRS-H7 TaxID=1623450 RepID=A0A0H4J3R3_9PROT|nr:N-acetylmuramoyl-L-alanine amidase [Methylophilales bacterium MBRSF5]AKO66378.1 N-acetylmuramoyl-L-alanine amidase [Methylophilales bacterium MBRS-H7]AKO67693.1 N-acetylmuramoyl-L-alanine amidase [Methylophilales bacterium MBRSG12]
MPLFRVCFSILLAFFITNVFADVQTRVWPSNEYTRFTIESTDYIKNDQSILKNPDRVVIDLKSININNNLKDLSKVDFKENSSISGVRVAQYDPSTVRIVVDLRHESKIKIFSLKPIKSYGHRLVVDVYHEEDEIAHLLKQLQAKASDDQKDNTQKVKDEKTNLTIKEESKDAQPKVAEQVKIVVAIDAGHGGEDPGARGSSGTKEKDITLAIAKKLRDAINKEPNLQGVLIRDGDYFVPLAKRVAKARKLEADLFVSIHADAFTKKSVKGSSVFALSERGASSAFAKFIANKENESDLIGGVSIDDKHPVLAQTLLDLSLSATINDSMKLGRYVLDEMGKVNTLHKKYVEQAGFAVLKAPDIPSILVETAFISNPKEEKNLRSESFQIKLAESVVKGIKTYLKTGANLAFFYESEQ